MFNLLVAYRLKHKKRKEFLNALTLADVIKRTLSEPGCIKYEFYLSAADEDKVLLIEQWDSESSQKAHTFGENIKKLVEMKKEYVIETEIKSFEFTNE